MELGVALTTADYDRLVRFYTSGLGLEPAQLWHNEQGRALNLDLGAAVERLLAHGASPVQPPVVTPWGDRNVRLQDLDGMQVTLFQPGT